MAADAQHHPVELALAPSLFPGEEYKPDHQLRRLLEANLRGNGLYRPMVLVMKSDDDIKAFLDQVLKKDLFGHREAELLNYYIYDPTCNLDRSFAITHEYQPPVRRPTQTIRQWLEEKDQSNPEVRAPPSPSYPHTQLTTQGEDREDRRYHDAQDHPVVPRLVSRRFSSDRSLVKGRPGQLPPHARSLATSVHHGQRHQQQQEEGRAVWRRSWAGSSHGKPRGRKPCLERIQLATVIKWLSSRVPFVYLTGTITLTEKSKAVREVKTKPNLGKHYSWRCAVSLSSQQPYDCPSPPSVVGGCYITVVPRPSFALPFLSDERLHVTLGCSGRLQVAPLVARFADNSMFFQQGIGGVVMFL